MPVPSPAPRYRVLWPEDDGYSQVVQVLVPDPSYYPNLDLILASEIEHVLPEWVVRLPDGSRMGARRLLTLWRKIRPLGGVLVRVEALG